MRRMSNKNGILHSTRQKKKKTTKYLRRNSTFSSLSLHNNHNNNVCFNKRYEKLFHKYQWMIGMNKKKRVTYIHSYVMCTHVM